MFITMNENFSTESEQHIQNSQWVGQAGGVGPGKPLSHIVVQTTSLIIIPNLSHLTFWQLLRSEGVQNKAWARDFANLIWIQRPLNVEVHSHMMHSPNRWLSHKPHQWAIMRRFLTTKWILHWMWITALWNPPFFYKTWRTYSLIVSKLDWHFEMIALSRLILKSSTFKDNQDDCPKTRLTIFKDYLTKISASLPRGWLRWHGLKKLCDEHLYWEEIPVHSTPLFCCKANKTV